MRISDWSSDVCSSDLIHSSSPLPRPSDLQFDNGWGGFAPDSGDYVICLEPGATTPAPWSNVLANDAFGTIVTEGGLGFTWATNSGENRLTPWFNDPIRDRSDEHTTELQSLMRISNAVSCWK